MAFQPDYEVNEDRRAYTLPAGRVGCLMVHGFMGSPKSSRPLAAYLAERGVTMHCPLLPGHGSLPEKISGFSGREWLAEAEDGLAALREGCDDVFLIGHSMGCVLGAHLAQSNSDIRGMIMLAPPYEVPDRRLRLFLGLRHVITWFYPIKIRRLRKLVYERALDFDPTLDLRDPKVQAWLPQATRIATASIAEMCRMADTGRQMWPRLRLPAIIFQGGRDVAVSPGNAQRVMAALPGPDKTLHYFPEAGHELMRPFDPAHKEVWPKVYDFIWRRAVQPLYEPAAAAA